MPEIADDEPASVDELARYGDAGRVPWNAPYYRRLGFTEIDAARVRCAACTGLAAIRARERAQGLDRWPRVAMIRPMAPEEQF